MLQQGLRPFVDHFVAAAHAASPSCTSPTRRIPGRADPARPRRRPPPVRRGRARRGRRRRPAGREARRPAVGPRARRRLPVHRARSTRPCARSRRRRAASSRSPTPSSGSSTTATRCATRCSQGWWIDTGKKDPLLDCNRLVLETIEPRIDGKVDDASPRRRPGGHRGGRRARSDSVVRGPGDHRRPAPGSSTRYVGPFTAVAADCEIIDAEIEHSVVLEHSRIIGVHRIHDSLIGRDVEVVRSGDAPGHPPDAGRPLRGRAGR